MVQNPFSVSEIMGLYFDPLYESRKQIMIHLWSDVKALSLWGIERLRKWSIWNGSKFGVYLLLKSKVDQNDQIIANLEITWSDRLWALTIFHFLNRSSNCNFVIFSESDQSLVFLFFTDNKKRRTRLESYG